MATSRFKIIRAYTRIYVELFQNVPLVIQIFFLFYALPVLGIRLDIFTIGVLGVGAYHGAYVSEVVRSGIWLCQEVSLKLLLLKGLLIFNKCVIL